MHARLAFRADVHVTRNKTSTCTCSAHVMVNAGRRLGAPMSVCPKLAKVADTLWLATTRHGSFGTLLGLVLRADGGGLRFHELNERQSIISCPWPRWAARADGALCLPTALAMHDEISTYGGMACWDARHRPGVSISIAGHLVGRGQQMPSVEADEELHFVSRRLKAGRQLGYIELEIWRGPPASAGVELLAVGRHCKSMQMPLQSAFASQLVELAGHPPIYRRLQPWAQRLLERRPLAPPLLDPTCKADLFPPLTPMQAHAPSDGGNGAGPRESSSSSAASAAARDSARDSAHDSAADAERLGALFPVAGAGNATRRYSSPLRPAWSNVLGTLHGGAACILGEQAAATALREALAEQGECACHRVPPSAAECRRVPPSAAECHRVPPSATCSRSQQTPPCALINLRAPRRTSPLIHSFPSLSSTGELLDEAPPARAMTVQLLSGLICDERPARIAAAAAVAPVSAATSAAASLPGGLGPGGFAGAGPGLPPGTGTATAALAALRDRGGRAVEAAVWFEPRRRR